jgi:hypothetical protein
MERTAEKQTIASLADRLIRLTPEQLTLVSRYIDSLESEAMACALASEATLAKYWDTPEEDAAWGDLLEAML